jgi:hypothetical protein
VEKVTEYGHREAAGGVEGSAYKRKPRERYEQQIARRDDIGSLRRNSYAAGVVPGKGVSRWVK